MLELQIQDDTTDVTLPAVRYERVRDLDEQARATVAVYREDWRDVEGDFDELNAELTIRESGDSAFGGRFGDSKADGMTVAVEVLSYEEDAADAEPTGSNAQYQNVDDDVIATDAITSVSSLSPGTVETVAPSLSYSASHASRSKILRDLRAATGAEVRYNADQTVDYVTALGSDRTDEVTISPDARTLGEDVSITRDTREEVTHVRVLGGQSGPDQVTAEAVADSYDGGREVWRRPPNKEIIDESRAQQTAETLVSEYDGEPRALRVEATVYGVDLELGDTVTVAQPDGGLEERPLRVVSLRTVRDTDGSRQVATFANRSLTREKNDRAKEVDDIQTFNRGYQGFIDRDQATSGWDVSGDGTPQSLLIPAWPDDIVEENRVELVVEGRAWRSPVKAAGHTHNFDKDVVQSEATVSNASGLSDGAWVDTNTFIDPTGSGSKLVVKFTNYVDDADDKYNIGTIDYRLKNDATGDVYPPGGYIRHRFTDSTAILSRYTNPSNFTIEAPGVSASDGDWELQARSDEDVDLGDHVTWATWYTTNENVEEETALAAEVIDEFDGQTFYPSDVEIAVDGDVVTTVAGDSAGDWQETIDLRGELAAGANTITATPTTGRGQLRLTLASELFRRGAEQS